MSFNHCEGRSAYFFLRVDSSQAQNNNLSTLCEFYIEKKWIDIFTDEYESIAYILSFPVFIWYESDTSSCFLEDIAHTRFFSEMYESLGSVYLIGKLSEKCIKFPSIECKTPSISIACHRSWVNMIILSPSHLILIFGIDTGSIEEEIEWHYRMTRPYDRCPGIYSSYSRLDEVHLIYRDEIRFIHDDEVSEFELIERSICRRCDLAGEVLRIHDTDDRVELHASLHIIHEKWLSNRKRVTHSRTLDDDMIDGVATRKKPVYRFNEVLAYSAAHASIRDLDDLFGRSFYKICIDPCRPEFILDDGDLASLGITDDMIEESGLPTSEESSKDSYRDELLHEWLFTEIATLEIFDWFRFDCLRREREVGFRNMITLCTVWELHSLFFMAVTEGKNTFIIDSYLMDDVFSYECIEYAVESSRIHLFCIDEKLLKITKGERISSFETFEDMTTMDSRKHSFYEYFLILCIFLQMQIFL